MEAFMLQDRLGLAPHIGLVSGSQKLIDVPRPELYNWVSDAHETEDLAALNMVDVVALKTTLDGFGFLPRDGSAMNLDPEVARQLEALGYVQPTEPVVAGAILEDAKDHQNLVRWTQRAERHLQRGEFEQADVLLKQLSEGYPKLVKPKSSRILSLGQLGRVEEALALAKQTHTDHPDDANVTALLAGLLGRMGDWAGAAKLYQEAAEGMPWAGHLRMKGVMSKSKVLGGEPEALALAERYLADDPDNKLLAGFVGLNYLGAHRVDEAMHLLEKAVTAEPPLAMVCFHLGAKAHQDGRLVDAERYLLREVAYHPDNVMAFRLLKDVYAAQQDWAGMVGLAQRALEQVDTPEWRHVKTQGLFNLKNYEACRRSLDPAIKRFPKNAKLALLDANLLKKEGRDADSLSRFKEAQQLFEQQKKGR
jgi:tetratricopeptide (TPR) repeat protein